MGYAFPKTPRHSAALSHASSAFRVARLLPGRFVDPIVCKLEYFPVGAEGELAQVGGI